MATGEKGSRDVVACVPRQGWGDRAGSATTFWHHGWPFLDLYARLNIGTHDSPQIKDPGSVPIRQISCRFLISGRVCRRGWEETAFLSLDQRDRGSWAPFLEGKPRSAAHDADHGVDLPSGSSHQVYYSSSEAVTRITLRRELPMKRFVNHVGA